MLEEKAKAFMSQPSGSPGKSEADKVMDSVSKQKMPETPMPVGAAGLNSMVGLFGPAALGGLGGALPGNSGMVPGTLRGMTAGVGGNLGHMLGAEASEALEHAGIQSPALRSLLPILGYGGGAYAGYRAGKALTKTDKEKAQEKNANLFWKKLKTPVGIKSLWGPSDGASSVRLDAERTMEPRLLTRLFSSPRKDYDRLQAWMKDELGNMDPEDRELGSSPMGRGVVASLMLPAMHPDRYKQEGDSPLGNEDIFENSIYPADKTRTKTDKKKTASNSQFETLKAPKVDISGLKNWNQLDPTAYSDDSGNSGWHLNMQKSAAMEKDALSLLAKAFPAALSWGGKAIANKVRAIPKMLGSAAKFLGKENPQVAGLGAAAPAAAGTWRNRLFDWGRKIRGTATNATNAANSAFQTNRVAPMMRAFNQLPQWGQKTLGALGSVGRFGGNVLAGGAGTGKGLGGMLGAGTSLWGAGKAGHGIGMYDGAQLGVQGAAGYASNMLDDLAGKADGSIIDRIGMAYKMSDPEFLRNTAKEMRDPKFVSKMMGR
jgi:hypothetical protein